MLAQYVVVLIARVGRVKSEQSTLRLDNAGSLLLTNTVLNDREKLRLGGIGRCLPDANTVDTSVLPMLVVVY